MIEDRQCLVKRRHSQQGFEVPIGEVGGMDLHNATGSDGAPLDQPEPVVQSHLPTDSAVGVEPVVSVVICTYNRPNYLNQALESVYNQTFRDFELIVADDGSDDSVVSAYNLQPGVRLVRSDTNTASSARTRNSGTELARGRYIAYLDDDDVWLPGKLESQVRVLENCPEFGLTYCHHIVVDEDLNPIAKQPAAKSLSGNCFRKLLHGNFIKSPSVVLVRRELVEQAGRFNEALPRAEDWDLWARMSHNCSISCSREPLVMYRTHSHQKTNRALVNRRGHVQVVEALIEWARDSAPEAMSDLRKSLAYRMQRCAKWEAREGDPRQAFALVRKAAMLNPLEVRVYGRLIDVLACRLRR